MQVEDKLVNLAPGMAVTVEIKTGSRRIISYLLSPLMRYKQESLRSGETAANPAEWYRDLWPSPTGTFDLNQAGIG